jgi:hypothetical protein
VAGNLVWSGVIFGVYFALRNFSNLRILNQKDKSIFS